MPRQRRGGSGVALEAHSRRLSSVLRRGGRGPLSATGAAPWVARAVSRKRRRHSTTLVVPRRMARVSTLPRWLKKIRSHAWFGWTSGISTTTWRSASSPSRPRRYSTIGGPIDRCSLTRVISGTSGCQSSQRRRNSASASVVRVVGEADVDRAHLLAQRERGRDAGLGQPRDGADRHHDQRAEPVRRGRLAAQPQDQADAPVGDVIRLNISTSSGTTMTTSQAPSRNLLNSSMASATVVNTAPMPLIAARRHQPRSLAALKVPVPDHADLRQGEPDENPDRKQRHQGLGVALGHDEQQRGGHREHPDAVPVHLPVGLEEEQVRQEVVPGQQRGQHRQAAERGVRGQRQQHRGDQLHGVEHEVVPERGRGQPGQHGRGRRRRHVVLADADGQPDQHQAEDDAQPHLGVLGPAGPRPAERGHGVGDRLHAGQRRAAGRERLEQEQQPDRLGRGGQAGVAPGPPGGTGSARRR